MFANLSVSRIGGQNAPHKAVLLLAIMRDIERNALTENRIYPGSEVVDAFAHQWGRYIKFKKVPCVWFPYYHLSSEPFWHFKKKNSPEGSAIEPNQKGTISIGKLRSLIQYAYLDSDLLEYMRNETARERLREVLIKNYIENYQ